MGDAPPDGDIISSPSPPNDAPTIMPVENATVPYWRSELHPIDSHRSSEQLPTECDIAIIGAGMSGVSTAYHLIQNSSDPAPSIVLLEARQVCSGATGRNGGHVKFSPTSITAFLKHYPLDAVAECVDLVLEQIYAIKHAVETEKLDCEFELRRSWNVFLDGAEAEEARVEFEKCVKAGQRWTRDVSFVGAKFAEQVTSIRGAKAAMSVPVCSLWPYKFVSQLLDRIEKKGQLNLQTHTPVLHVSTGATNNLNILHTPRGKLTARKVIFATNAYTSGICPPYKDKIIPTLATATHISLSSPISPHLAATYNIHYPPSINPGGEEGIERVDYLNPRPDGSIVVGGAKWTYQARQSSWYNRWDDSVLLPGQARAHFDGLMQNYFRGWEDSGAGVDWMWTGVIGVTGDGVAHIGEVPSSRAEGGREGGKQYVIAGFNGGGMAFIFLCAKGLAKMVSEGLEYEKSGLPRVLKTTERRLGR